MQTYFLVIELLDNFERFECVSSETRDFKTNDFVNLISLNIVDEFYDFRTILVLLGARDFVGEDSQYSPPCFVTVFGEFIDLTVIVLMIGGHST